MSTEKRFRVTFKGPDGSRVHITLMAESREAAERLAQKAQFRREERFPLTFQRLEHTAATGEPGMLAIDPRFAGAALTEAWVKAETEKRKADQDRYVKGFTVESVKEVK